MSIYFVSEDKAADFSGGTFGNPALPFGMQYALDNAGQSDEIRVMAGANEYGVGSFVWTGSGRNADKSFDVDAAGGSQDTPKKIFGYNAAGTAEELVVLDFDTGTGVGFATLTIDNIIWMNIHVKGCDGDGWDLDASADFQHFNHCRASDNGGDGWGGSSQQVRFVDCLGNNNTLWGSSVVDATYMYCEFHTNSETGAQSGSHFGTLSDNNVESGVASAASQNGGVFCNCSFIENDADGIDLTAAEQVMIVNCIISGHQTASTFGLRLSTGEAFFEINCNYDDNIADNDRDPEKKVDRTTLAPGFVLAASRDFAIGTNLKAAGIGGFLSGASTGFVDIGAVQREEAGAGGGGMKLVGRGGLAG